MMLLPGFGSSRLPMRVRSLLAVAVSLALFPLLYENAYKVTANSADFRKAELLLGEILIGVSLGLLARMFMIGLQFSATILTNTIGLAPTPGAPIDDLEATPPLVNFVSLCGTMMIFATDMHIVLIGAIIDSYNFFKVGSPIDIGFHLDRIVNTLGKTSELGLRLSGPYIVYSVVVNLAIGFLNKFTPQISVYFVTTGMVASGGLFLLYFSISDWLNLFRLDFSSFFG